MEYSSRSSFTSVSLTPPLVSVCVAHTSTTWPLLRHRDRLGEVGERAVDHRDLDILALAAGACALLPSTEIFRLAALA